MSLILSAYYTWSAETIVILFGLIHGFGGASVAVNLATISYISDISTPETKVRVLKKKIKKKPIYI